jgi:hypothetical protein
VTIGNGKNTPFWEVRWLHGIVPKEIAPNLHKVARYKSRSISYELQNNRWLQNICNTFELEEFVMLFMALIGIELSDQRDTIS